MKETTSSPTADASQPVAPLAPFHVVIQIAAEAATEIRRNVREVAPEIGDYRHRMAVICGKLGRQLRAKEDTSYAEGMGLDAALKCMSQGAWEEIRPYVRLIGDESTRAKTTHEMMDGIVRENIREALGGNGSE